LPVRIFADQETGTCFDLGNSVDLYRWFFPVKGLEDLDGLGSMTKSNHGLTSRTFPMGHSSSLKALLAGIGVGRAKARKIKIDRYFLNKQVSRDVIVSFKPNGLNLDPLVD
jgi:hypothetical protein